MNIYYLLFLPLYYCAVHSGSAQVHGGPGSPGRRQVHELWAIGAPGHPWRPGRDEMYGVYEMYMISI